MWYWLSKVFNWTKLRRSMKKGDRSSELIKSLVVAFLGCFLPFFVNAKERPMIVIDAGSLLIAEVNPEERLPGVNQLEPLPRLDPTLVVRPGARELLGFIQQIADVGIVSTHWIDEMRYALYGLGLSNFRLIGNAHNVPHSVQYLDGRAYGQLFMPAINSYIDLRLFALEWNDPFLTDLIRVNLEDEVSEAERLAMRERLGKTVENGWLRRISYLGGRAALLNPEQKTYWIDLQHVGSRIENFEFGNASVYRKSLQRTFFVAALLERAHERYLAEDLSWIAAVNATLREAEFLPVPAGGWRKATLEEGKMILRQFNGELVRPPRTRPSSSPRRLPPSPSPSRLQLCIRALARVQ